MVNRPGTPVAEITDISGEEQEALFDALSELSVGNKVSGVGQLIYNDPENRSWEAFERAVVNQVPKIDRVIVCFFRNVVKNEWNYDEKIEPGQLLVLWKVDVKAHGFKFVEKPESFCQLIHAECPADMGGKDKLIIDKRAMVVYIYAPEFREIHLVEKKGFQASLLAMEEESVAKFETPEANYETKVGARTFIEFVR